MTVSYKTLWQEASTEVKRLKDENKRLRRVHQRELDKIYSFIQSGRSGDTSQTRAIVDLAGIARHLRVARFTPQQWQQRDLLPPVDFPEISVPLWYASTIQEQFAQPTGRPWYDLAEEFDGLEPGLSAAA